MGQERRSRSSFVLTVAVAIMYMQTCHHIISSCATVKAAVLFGLTGRVHFNSTLVFLTNHKILTITRRVCFKLKYKI